MKQYTFLTIFKATKDLQFFYLCQNFQFFDHCYRFVTKIRFVFNFQPNISKLLLRIFDAKLATFMLSNNKNENISIYLRN